MTYRTIATVTFTAAALAAIVNIVVAAWLRDLDHIADLHDLFDDNGEAYDPELLL